jgi:hypothetical protein
MPVMNFDLEDGLPPVSFSINGEGAERMMNFMAECQQNRDAHAMLTAEISELRARIESLVADAERLDKLEQLPKMSAFGKAPSGVWQIFDGAGNVESSHSIRAAADVLIAKEKA